MSGFTDKNSTWPEHRDELLAVCFNWGVTWNELRDATGRMPEFSPAQHDDLMSRASQILR
jgi:hypothetical protein